MKKVLIGGIGDLLGGDGGVGPYVIHLLEHHYHFQEGVRLREVGASDLDLTGEFSGIDAVILVDAVANDTPPGTLALYRRQDIAPNRPQPMGMHWQPLSWLESFLTAGSSTDRFEVLFIAIAGERFDRGGPLSPSVRKAAVLAVEDILLELDRLDVDYAPRAGLCVPSAWWEALADPIPV